MGGEIFPFLVYGWGIEWVEGIFVIVLLRNFLELFFLMSYRSGCLLVSLLVIVFIVFRLLSLQSGRVRVTCFNLINNQVGFMLDPFT